MLSAWMPLSSCANIPSLLTSGGPNVAANVQLGKTNSQTLGTTNNVAPTVSLRPNSKVDTVDQSNETVNNYELDPILFGTLLFCFIVWSYFLYKLPSPDQIWKRR